MTIPEVPLRVATQPPTRPLVIPLRGARRARCPKPGRGLFYGPMEIMGTVRPSTGLPTSATASDVAPAWQSSLDRRSHRSICLILNCMSYEDDGWERGWHDSDKYICSACVDDNYLKSVVADSLITDECCSFCDTVGAAAFDTFMEAFMVGVDNSFEQADNAGMPWDGGYVFEDAIYTAYDIADAFSWVTGGEYGDQVFEEIRDRLDPDKVYASRWWIELEPEKAYTGAWEEFREQIEHRTRFVFWANQGKESQREGAGEVAVARVLDAIGALLETFDLITPLPREHLYIVLADMRTHSILRSGTQPI
jgi:HEPN/RES N-terminal domain 1